MILGSVVEAWLGSVMTTGDSYPVPMVLLGRKVGVPTRDELAEHSTCLDLMALIGSMIETGSGKEWKEIARAFFSLNLATSFHEVSLWKFVSKHCA